MMKFFQDFFARHWPWLAAALAIALAVHAASVLVLPRAIMWRTLAVLSRDAGTNTMSHAQRANADSRLIVRPSPDLLYSTCPFDLAKAHGALRVHAQGMPATYWSVSAFDAATGNFFVRNDRAARGGAVDFLIIAPGTFVDGTRLPVIVSPSERGIVLFRTLINDETRLAEIDARRRNAACEAFAGE
jgi:uncharacterized membrane protein